ncbi:MAG: hypothetical protein GY870_13970, partial [archaeon]|nr:hypothetical protein [archaeon]
MVNHEILQRNENIIGKRLIQQLNYTISKGNEYITSELNGLLYLLFAPTINTLYKSFARSIINSGSKKQIKILIDTAKRVVCNGFSIDECMDLQSKDFLHNDPILTKFKKGHKNYNWMVENTKNKFRAQLNPIV